MSRDIKVTDKRIFTAEGDLKEEFRHLEEEKGETSEASPSTDEPRQEGPTAGSPIVPPSAPSPEQPRREPSAGPPGAPSGPRAGDASPEERFASPDAPDAPDEMGSPDFLDLVSMLAQPAALYLGDARLPDGRSAEDLDMARIHIDMLDLLREKTAGNLTPEESSTLEDVLYQLRMRYVRKRG